MTDTLPARGFLAAIVTLATAGCVERDASPPVARNVESVNDEFHRLRSEYDTLTQCGHSNPQNGAEEYKRWVWVLCRLNSLATWHSPAGPEPDLEKWAEQCRQARLAPCEPGYDPDNWLRDYAR